MLWSNVERRINAVARLLEHAEATGVGNVAKSSYYRSAIILLCTVVEGMVYELVKKHTSSPRHVISKAIKYIEKYKISSIDRASNFNFENLFICEKLENEISIDGKGADFGKFNLHLKNHHIISESEYKTLDWVRNERNKLHLQGLNTPDTGYTKTKIEKIGKIISFLGEKIH